jgi:hypothetical protein
MVLTRGRRCVAQALLYRLRGIAVLWVGRRCAPNLQKVSRPPIWLGAKTLLEDMTRTANGRPGRKEGFMFDPGTATSGAASAALMPSRSAMTSFQLIGYFDLRRVTGKRLGRSAVSALLR